MPRTFGDSLIHESHIDVMVNVDYPLPELKTGEPDNVEKTIGKLIAENLVDNGATLQMGIMHIELKIIYRPLTMMMNKLICPLIT